MIQVLKPLFGKFTNFAKNRMGFEYPPKLFLRNDAENAKSHLGKTAYYDPGNKAITIFMTGRHPKDILRSFAHELVHHTQNLRGDLSPEKCGEMGGQYAQENPHMRKMEEEAYLVGNMCFRDWEDNEKFNLQESKILKENKTMTNKITKESLKDMIRDILERKMTESSALYSRDDDDLGPGGEGLPGDEEETMPSGEFEEFGHLDAEEAEEGWGDGPESPIDLGAVSEPADLLDLVKATISKLEAQLGGALEEQNKADESDDGEGCAVEEATTHQDVVDAADDAVDATNKAAAKEKSKKAAAKKPAKDPGAKYDDDLFDASEAEEDEIAGVNEALDSDCGCTDLNGTPERENNLYEARFAKRNTNLFEGLVKKWAK